MKNKDSKGHVTGRSIYIDDIPENKEILYGALVTSPVSHGIIEELDISAAEAVFGVVKVLTAHDIPGENQIGAIVRDEPLLAEKNVHFTGQPIAVVLAIDEETAQMAAKKIILKIKEIEAVIDPRLAAEKKQFLVPSRTFKQGDVTNAWGKCVHIIEGRATSGGQEHLYLETQSAYAVPLENGNIKIYSSTQGPTGVQSITARVLNFPMHRIEVDVNRLGGGFGGKEDQATPWAVMCALGVFYTGKPVKIILPRNVDMITTGKRHPYEYDFKIGLDKNLKIIAFEAVYYQNGGAATDLSPAIMERTLFHVTNAYFIPNVKATVHSCRTNIPPSTAFRGFGAPQAMFLIESAIAKAADVLGVSTIEIQKKNLIRKGETFPYGQSPDQDNAVKVWEQYDEEFNINNEIKKVEEYNKTHLAKKKGYALTPICFGISFTNKSMNQARALVHIYYDGSIGISTGAIEMGQGVNTKLMQVAAKTLSVNTKRVKIESTNTTRVSNTSPTAASSGADLNGKALEIACRKLYIKLIKVAAGMLNASENDIILKDENVFIVDKKTDITWEKLIMTAHFERIGLTENGHYATPGLHFDTKKEQGNPFAYYVFGVAGTIVTVDTIRGTYQIDKVNIVHDFGNTINKIIDYGQIEGAVMQGIGWLTIEDLQFAENGRLLANTLSTYKIPDIYFTPQKINISELKTKGHEAAILKSKAVGEPPFNYGIGSFIAIQQAIKSFNKNYNFSLDAPLTNEKVLIGLYD